jgi:hypothetical protein
MMKAAVLTPRLRAKDSPAVDHSKARLKQAKSKVDK